MRLKMKLVIVLSVIFAASAAQRNPANPMHPRLFVQPGTFVWDILKQPLTAAEVETILASRTGNEYPTYNTIPGTGFQCSAYKQPGWYADIETGCQVFHRCDQAGNMTSYICVNSTIFNQITLICDAWFNVECQRSGEFVDFANSRLYTDQPLFDTPPAEYVPTWGLNIPSGTTGGGQVTGTHGQLQITTKKGAQKPRTGRAENGSPAEAETGESNSLNTGENVAPGPSEESTSNTTGTTMMLNTTTEVPNVETNASSNATSPGTGMMFNETNPENATMMNMTTEMPPSETNATSNMTSSDTTAEEPNAEGNSSSNVTSPETGMMLNETNPENGTMMNATTEIPPSEANSASNVTSKTPRAGRAEEGLPTGEEAGGLTGGQEDASGRSDQSMLNSTGTSMMNATTEVPNANGKSSLNVSTTETGMMMNATTKMPSQPGAKGNLSVISSGRSDESMASPDEGKTMVTTLTPSSETSPSSDVSTPENSEITTTTPQPVK